MLSAKPWKLEEILRLLAGIFVGLIFVSLAQLGYEHFAGKMSEGSLVFLLFSSLSLHGSILFATGIFLWLHRISWGEAFGFTTPPMSRAVLLGMIAALAFLPVGIVLQDVSLQLLTWWHVPTPPQEAVEEFDRAGSLASRAYLAFFAIALAPVAEEVLFRGILYPALKQLGLPQFALWGSALIFAAIHHSAPIFLPLLALGALLAWLYDKTNNLLTSITAHAAFNAINVVFIFQDQIKEMFHRQQHLMR
jgi:membrane protease YdiL (CAAX protease family)